jgi:uncharacterized membrane protein YphA (DoxX/SURF4 family)
MEAETRQYEAIRGNRGERVTGRAQEERLPRGAPRASLAPWLATAARLLLAVVWTWAAISKIADPDASVRAVRAYRILPEVLVEPVGWGLPFLELGLALLLAAGLATRLVAAVSAALLVVFMIGIVTAWARGLRIDCGCFGGGGDDPTAGTGTYLRDLVRDGGLVVVAVGLTMWPRSRLAVDNLVGGPPGHPHAPSSEEQ